MAGKKRKGIATAVGVVAVLFIAIQFRPVTRTNPPVRNEVSAPPEVASVLRDACYDCHSNETRWPWYSRVAPASWFLVDHVDSGRRDLNFSDWPVIDFEAQDHLLRDIAEEVSEGEMPPRSYKLLHPEARLSAEQVELVLSWARGK